jgi:hypothetical protein
MNLEYQLRKPVKNYSNDAGVLSVWRIESEVTILFRGKSAGTTIFSGINC